MMIIFNSDFINGVWITVMFTMLFLIVLWSGVEVKEGGIDRESTAKTFMVIVLSVDFIITFLIMGIWLGGLLHK